MSVDRDGGGNNDSDELKEKRRRDFERSLAGPSVGKAGLVRDQTEINRIIADASKVTTRKAIVAVAHARDQSAFRSRFIITLRFYLNQVRKDEGECWQTICAHTRT